MSIDIFGKAQRDILNIRSLIKRDEVHCIKENEVMNI